jgi:hypothetical protein
VTNETRANGISVTIKYGKGYEQTWVTFQGSGEQVRADVLSYFGMDRLKLANLTLSELVVNATGIAHGVGNVAAGLGAMVVPDAQSGVESPAVSASATDPWTEAANRATEAAPANPLLAEIATAATIDALKAIWARNQSAFSDSAVMEAWRAKGRSLQQSS